MWIAMCSRDSVWFHNVDRDSAYIAGVRDMQIPMSSRDNSAISQLRTPTEIVRDVIYYNALSIRLSATVLTVRCVRLLWCIYQSDFFTHLSVRRHVAINDVLSNIYRPQRYCDVYVCRPEYWRTYRMSHYSFVHLPSVCLPLPSSN